MDRQYEHLGPLGALGCLLTEGFTTARQGRPKASEEITLYRLRDDRRQEEITINVTTGLYGGFNLRHETRQIMGEFGLAEIPTDKKGGA